MSLVDPVQIETLLTEAKLTSMSQIVAFITNHVHKTTIVPITDLQERVSHLEHPKGMDRVMIEEVKTLVDAMLDQREESYKRDADKRYGNSFEFQDQSRRSLNEIDFTNLMNIPQQSQQFKKNYQQSQPLPSLQLAPKTQNFTHEIHQLREEMLNKPQRREIQQLKQVLNNISKQVVSKVTFDDAEKMMIRFQKQIYVKLNQQKVEWQDVQNRLSRAMQLTLQQTRGELAEIVKGRTNSLKLEKKVKKYLQEMAYIRSDLQKLSQSISDNHNQCNRQYKSQLDGMQMLQGVIEKIAEEDQEHPQTNFRLPIQGANEYGLFMAGPIATKNCMVAWQKSIENRYAHLFEFQSGKTSIRVVSAGFYEIICCIWGGNGKKAPMLLSNGQTVGRCQARNGGEGVARWSWREWVHLPQPKSTLCIKYEGEQFNTCAMLYIRTITY